jgi:hypothetical protein
MNDKDNLKNQQQEYMSVRILFREVTFDPCFSLSATSGLHGLSLVGLGPMSL